MVARKCNNTYTASIHHITEYIDEDNYIKKWYYVDGKVETEIPFMNGKAHGIKINYHPNGKISVITPYINDKTHGIEKHYMYGGRLEREIPYINGELHGAIKVYDKNLQVKQVFYYLYDKRVTEEEYKKYQLTLKLSKLGAVNE